MATLSELARRLKAKYEFAGCDMKSTNVPGVHFYSVDERIEQIRTATRHLSGVEVISFDGLTVNCAVTHHADLILRGLRAMSDFEYELQIAHTNRSLADDLETVFMATTARHSFLSSSVVKEVARFGGSIDHMVPPEVAKDLNRLFNSTFHTS